MTGVVLKALRRRCPALRVTIETTARLERLGDRFIDDYTLVPETPDFGFVMHSATSIDLAASAARYTALHGEWERVVEAAAGRIAAHRPDLVLSNIAYAPLAGAARLGIPALAFAPLEWHGLSETLLGDQPGMAAVLADMAAAYGSVRETLCAEPSMPMTALPNHRPVGPVATVAQGDRAALAAAMGLAEEERVVVMSFGGVDSGLDIGCWPQDLGRWRLAVHSGQAARHPRSVDLHALGWPFGRVLASADAVLTKPGYGMVTECACAGRPVLYVDRPDWPEVPHLLPWLHRHTAAAEIPVEDLRAGRIAGPLDALLAQPRPVPPDATGVEEAAERVMAWLERGDAAAIPGECSGYSPTA